MLPELRKIIKNNTLDYFILPINDSSFLEYVLENNNLVKFLTGFTGSNAFVILTLEGKNKFFTDSRYILQANQTLDLSYWDVLNIATVNPYDFINNNDFTVGYDPKIIPMHKIKKLKCKLIPFENNPIEEIWTDRPIQDRYNIFDHDLCYAGISDTEKIKKVALDEPLFIAESESICWLLNLRSNYLPNNPIFVCYLP